jgi:DNA-binding MarR family transcriptional regulator
MSSPEVSPTITEVAPDSVAARLAFVVGRMNRRLGVASGGLSHGLLTALATVAKQGPLRLAELAQIEIVSAPAITRAVAELENRGLVARSIDPTDGRAFQIELTPAGAEAILRARAARAAVISDMVEQLDTADVATIEAALPALERLLGDA